MLLSCMCIVGKFHALEPYGSRSGKRVGRKIGSVVVTSVLVKSGCKKRVGRKSSSVAVASVLVETKVQWLWQVCWWEQEFSGSSHVCWWEQKFSVSGKRVGVNIGRVVVKVIFKVQEPLRRIYN